MKKIISIFLIIIILMLVLQACCNYDNSSVAASDHPMFNMINYKAMDDFYIVYHKDTKVMYAVSNGASNRGTFTLLVNPDGTPMLYEED